MYYLLRSFLLGKKEKVVKSSTCRRLYSDVTSAGKKLRKLFKLRKLEVYLVTFVTITVCNLHVHEYTRLQFPFPSGKVSSQLKSRKLIYRDQQYQHVGNEKRSDVFIV